VRHFKSKLERSQKMVSQARREIEVSIEEDGKVHTARMRGWPARENRVEKGGTRRMLDVERGRRGCLVRERGPGGTRGDRTPTFV